MKALHREYLHLPCVDSASRHMDIAPMRTILRLSFFLAALSLAGCGSVIEPIPEDPVPLYWGIEKDGWLQGWARREEAWCACDSATLHATWTFPRDPFLRLCEIEYQRASGDLSRYDCRLGPGGEPWLRGRLAAETGGEFAWLATGWGDLELRRQLSATPPLPLDPRSPLSFEALGAAWDEAGRPETLELTTLIIEDPRDVTSPHPATLYYDGQLDPDGFPRESFRLERGEDTIHFKLFAQDFPRLWASLAMGVTLQYWGASPPNLTAFDPNFPEPAAYGVAGDTIESAHGDIHVIRFLPEGNGPFPALLMVAGAGPADADQGALFGFLADDLARAGILVMRYDKPGAGASTGSLDRVGLAERREIIDLLFSDLEADAASDPERIALLGYGEGAALALEAANRVDAAAVVALSPWLNRLDQLAEIPEAVDGPFILLGLECFGDKYLDRLGFDPAISLPLLNLPVLVCGAGLDGENPLQDVLEQVDLIEEGAADLDYREYPALGAAYNSTVPDLPPDPQFTQGLLDWLAATLP